MASGLLEILRQAGVITPEEARTAAAYCDRGKVTPGLAVVELGFCEPRNLASRISSLLGVDMVGSDDFAGLGTRELTSITSEMASEFRTVPVRVGDARMLLAMSDPTNRRAMEEVSQFTGLTVVPAVASEADLSAALYHYYSVGGPPPDSGPMHVSWKPSLARPGVTPSAPAAPNADAPMLTPEPVGVGVRIKLGRHEPMDLDNERGPEPVEQSPISKPKVAEPMTDELKHKYSSLDWWLGRTDDKVIKVRSPKGLDQQIDEPEDMADLLPLLEPVTRRKKTTLELVKPQVQEARTKPSTLEFPAPKPPPAPWSGDPMLQEIAGAHDRDAITDISLQYMLQGWSRAAIFVVRHEMVFGLAGAGEDLESRIVRAMIIPLNAPSVFRRVMQEGSSYVGPPLDNALDRMFFKALGATPSTIVVLPLTIPDGRIVSFLYGDSGKNGKASPGDPRLEVLRQAGCQAMENILRKAKEGSTA